ncbi:MAG: hypothetical protein JXM73_21960 [Anaerolineae bacterium]|nr:hypothetical protein [Anaerolineae bacterium]
MNKKTDAKTLLAGIGLLLVVIFGCISFMGDSLRKRDVSEEPVTPLPLQIPGYEGVFLETLCLEVSQAYPEEWFGFFKETLVKLGMNITPRQYSFPYESVITEILQGIGVQVVEDSQCDARLTLEVTGKSSGRTYGNMITKQGRNICYTDSDVSGILLISFENNDEYKTFVSGRVQPRETTTSSNCPDQPYKAPFVHSSAETVTDALVSLWGPDIAGVIYRRYRGGNSEIDEELTIASKTVLSNKEENAPVEPEAVPTFTPKPLP